MANLVGIAALAAAGLWGEWEWMLPCAILLLELRRRGAGSREVLEGVGPGIVWLALYAWSGDRQFYFPYCMQYAAQMACLPRGGGPGTAVAGGLGVTILFLAIRVWQEATGAVLLVELMAAVVILGTAICFAGARRRSVVGAAASLAAFVAFMVI